MNFRRFLNKRLKLFSPGPNRTTVGCRCNRPEQRAESQPIDKLYHIDTWIFDLDNTLYPESCDLFSQINRKMMLYMVELLNVSHDEAAALRKSFYEKHGTTLNGLMMEYGADPHPFLDYVHDVDLSPIAPAPGLGNLISSLPGRCLVHTNGTTRHAENVLGKMEISHVFDGIFDIVGSGFVPKPKTGAFRQMADEFDVDPSSAVMFEDKHENLEVPHQIGMKTVLISESEPEFPAPDLPHVHFQTDRLDRFLASFHDHKRTKAAATRT